MSPMSPRISHGLLGHYVLFIVLCLSLTQGSAAGQDPPNARTLTLGQSHELTLAGEQAHTYNIALTAGQYLRVVVEQRGIDVVVALFTAEGRKVTEADNASGTPGRESIAIIAEATGTYRIEVRAADKKAAAGRYEVKIEALRAATETDKTAVTAAELFKQGKLLHEQGTADALGSAIKKYEDALSLFRAVGDRRGEADALANIGEIYYGLGERQKALDYFSQSLPLLRALNDREGEADVLGNIGAAYDSLGERQKALDYYTQSLQLSRAIGDRSGEAVTLNNIGVIYGALGEKRKALEYYNLSLPLRRAVGDRKGEAYTLGGIGNTYSSLGEKQKALDYFAQALLIHRAIGNSRGEAVMLSSLGVVSRDLGEMQKALDYYNQSLPLRRAIGDRNGEARTLINMGAIYDDLGEKQQALDYYAQALPLIRAVGDRTGEAHLLTNIGVIYDYLGEKQKALDYYTQSLQLARAVGSRSDEANTLNHIGEVYSSLGDKQKALNYYLQALALHQAIGERMGQAYTLNNIGVAYGDLGDRQKALDHLAQALPLRRAVGDRVGEASTLYSLARLERTSGNLTGALTHIEGALAIIESLRAKIASQQLRSSYFATVQKYYEFYIDLLMQLHKRRPAEGHDGEALQASERGRARSLLETLAEAGADIRQGVDPKLVERERDLQKQLNAKAQEQMKLLGDQRTEEQAKAIAKEIEALMTEYRQVQTRIRQTSPRYAALTQPVPLSLKEIQTEVLDKDTLLLEYSLGADRSYLWAVTPDSIKSYEVPKRDEIDDAARRVYELLNARNQFIEGETREQRRARVARADAQYLDAAARLSQIILSPVASELRMKRLLVVSDGALQYIPFAALTDPSSANQAAARPLIVRHEVVSLPSASTLAVLRGEVAGRKPAPKAVAVLADPVYDSEDERIRVDAPQAQSNGRSKRTRRSRRTPSPRARGDLSFDLERSARESGLRDGEVEFPRLKGTGNEARAITSLLLPTQSKQALGFDANLAAATAPDLLQYRYVHFATHGLLNSVHPEMSGLVLSLFDQNGKPQEGFLRANQIYNLKLPAELVVLSACQTGLGKEVKGEGLVSLTRGFMYAGAPRVVVSLWSVSDAATAELMARFYRKMLKEGLRPAAALRAAQVSMIEDNQKNWTSPYYWAAFTLQGEWR